MKKTPAICGMVITAIAVLLLIGAGSSDPLISLSYLNGQFENTLSKEIDLKLDAADDAVRSTCDVYLNSLEGQSVTGTMTEAMLKRGDILTGGTGLAVMPYGGVVRVSFSSGAVVDATAGHELQDGTILEPKHKYLVAENTVAAFVAESPAVSMCWQGIGSFTSSGEQDYFSIARALRSIDLFRGTDTAFGEGFDLHVAPNRGQGIVMFIRLLGEEREALNANCSHPFTDVPDWLSPYVGWAYEKGYSNGVGSNLFGTEMPISAVSYVEFILRALGLSKAGVTDYSTALERALESGLINREEYSVLVYETFLRAHVAYLSFYAMDGELADLCIGKGAFTRDQLNAAKRMVTVPRLG